MTGTALTSEIIKKAPKVLLHEHLDGGLRPETVLELADESGYDGLPTKDPEQLRRWFVADAPGSDLVGYLAGFAHICLASRSVIGVTGRKTQKATRKLRVWLHHRFHLWLHQTLAG